MTAWFVDTSFLLALLLTDDELHDRAVVWQRKAKTRLVTTEYVLVELADALTNGPLRWMALQTIDALRADSSVQVVPASPALFTDGLRLYKARADKQWGLTDCISFVVMEGQNLTEALTADHHFEQAGFRALLRYEP